MNHLKINTAVNNHTLYVQMIGQLDEDATLSKIEISEKPGIHDILINWDGVKSINSCGIREWIKWIHTVPKDIRITFEKCPRIIINQVNLVNGFLPKGAVISSFYIPYFCASCDSITTVLCSTEASISNSHFNLPKDIPCEKCKMETEMDIVPAKYFRFLKGDLI